MTAVEGYNAYMQPPSSGDNIPAASREAPPAYTSLSTFELPKGEDRHYVQQYADMYFLRLVQLKPIVEQVAAEAWENYQVERVLDVRQGELCWVVGTIYMEMPLKPKVLDDISKEHWISAPPPREKYISPDGTHETMIEDESGRLRLTGRCLKDQILVTGAIIAAIGTENSDGVFEVADIIVADLPRQPARWELEDSASAVSGKNKKDTHKPSGNKIALISGLQISGSATDLLQLNLLAETLCGELGGPEVAAKAATISRLIIAGDSLANACPIPSREELAATKRGGSKKYGYDASSYNAAPTDHLDAFLESILPTIPVTLLPGQTDPANVQIPQQPLHPALFPKARTWARSPAKQAEDAGPGTFDPVTNPWEGEVEGWRFLGSGGQPVSDVFKYVESDDRLEMMASMLRWRCNAPTAPDTLWCYPFQDDDPLLITDCPHVYFAGNQPAFGTRIIEGPAGQEVVLIALPRFKETGQVVLVDSETREVEVIEVGLVEK
ncbi:DNA polymerase delta subunit 2 [Neofusicoccum parvum]|uniref:DNA polymerase delta subunit 2 n=1 Tax=Neofusicoccum parvum TaxID=310453 RepID=A0ACB5RVW8_9PEZI|nr:DNA polymerase delta subunit 2 [Neofusicoccum parvum]